MTGRWITIVSVLLLACLAGCGANEAETMRQQAIERVEAGRLDEGLVLLESIVERFPDSDVAVLAEDDLAMYRSLREIEKRYPSRKAREEMVRVARALDRYRGRHRRYPAALADLPKGAAAMPRDPWGGPLRYERRRRGRSYVLVCLGEDGAPGGDGTAEDILVESGAFVASLTGAYP